MYTERKKKRTSWVSKRRFILSYISVIYATAHRCVVGLKKFDLRSGSQRHRHFVRFFNVPVQAPIRDQPFYMVIPRNRPINSPLTTRWGYIGRYFFLISAMYTHLYQQFNRSTNFCHFSSWGIQFAMTSLQHTCVHRLYAKGTRARKQEKKEEIWYQQKITFWGNRSLNNLPSWGCQFDNK